MKRIIVTMASALLLALFGSTALADVPELIVKRSANDQIIIVSIDSCQCGPWILEGADCKSGPWKDLTTLSDEPYQILAREAPRYLRLWSPTEQGRPVALFPPVIPELEVKFGPPSCEVLCITACIRDCELWVLQGSGSSNGPWRDLTTLKNEPYQILVEQAPKFLRVWSPDVAGKAIDVFPTPRLEVKYGRGILSVTPATPLAPGDNWALEESLDLKCWLIIKARFEMCGWQTEVKPVRPPMRFYRLIKL